MKFVFKLLTLMLVIQLTLSQYKNICHFPGCRCSPEVPEIRSVICKCETKDQVIDIDHTVEIPLSIHSIDISGCGRVDLFPSGLSDANMLDNFRIANTSGVNLEPNSLPIVNYLTLEHIGNLNINQQPSASAEAVKILFRNITMETILGPSIITDGKIDNLTIIDSNFKQGIAEQALEINSSNTVSIINCKIQSISPKAIDIRNSNEILFQNNLFGTVEKSAFKFGAQRIGFLNNRFQNITGNIFDTNSKNPIMANAKFYNNTINRLESISNLESILNATQWDFTSNSIDCHCDFIDRESKKNRNKIKYAKLLQNTFCTGTKVNLEKIFTMDKDNQSKLCIKNSGNRYPGITCITMLIMYLLNVLLI